MNTSLKNMKQSLFCYRQDPGPPKPGSSDLNQERGPRCWSAGGQRLLLPSLHAHPLPVQPTLFQLLVCAIPVWNPAEIRSPERCNKLRNKYVLILGNNQLFMDNWDHATRGSTFLRDSPKSPADPPCLRWLQFSVHLQKISLTLTSACDLLNVLYPLVITAGHHVVSTVHTSAANAFLLAKMYNEAVKFFSKDPR